jgi:hypothetical protein
MRIAPYAAVAIMMAGWAGAAKAEALDVHSLYRKAEAMVQSLFKPALADREVLKPPADIDPKMALAPPGGGTLRLIEPSRPFRQW